VKVIVVILIAERFLVMLLFLCENGKEVPHS